ncbi:MAG: hypothetical protein ACRCZ2_12615 [Fusobacteriaceae bacterium]
MKRILALAGVALLSGCSTTVDQIPHGDGGVGYVVECNGPLQKWSMCYEKASEVCNGATFAVVNEQSISRPFGGMFIIGSTKDRSMVIKCDEPIDFSDDSIKFIR